MSSINQSQKDRLMDDLHAVVAEAESLLRATAGSASEGASELRAKVQAAWTVPSEIFMICRMPLSTRPRPPAGRPTTMCMRTPGSRSAWRPASASCWAC